MDQGGLQLDVVGPVGLYARKRAAGNTDCLVGGGLRGAVVLANHHDGLSVEGVARFG